MIRAKWQEAQRPCQLPLECSFPVFGNVERPLELEMSMIVVIDKLGDSFIMPSREHPGRGLFLSELLHVHWLISGVGWIASNHLLVLANSDAFTLESLNVFQTREDFMLDDERGLHLVPAAFLDGERLVFERLDSTCGGEIYRDVWSAFDFL